MSRSILNSDPHNKNLNADSIDIYVSRKAIHENENIAIDFNLADLIIEMANTNALSTKIIMLNAYLLATSSSEVVKKKVRAQNKKENLILTNLFLHIETH